MLSIICLAWIGTQLGAPAWYFGLLMLMVFINIISYGIKMYNKGKSEAD